MSVASAAPPSLRMIRLEDIAESTTNPRQTFGDLTELTASIRKDGVLQPVLVRPHPAPTTASVPPYELVDGHRRFRAASSAGLEEIPAQVRDLTDLEVLEAQLVANSQRADVPPLEEAEGYRRLRDEFHLDVEAIAAKVSKSVASVYARLKLCDLGKEGRKALEAGVLTASTALLVARLPPKLQGEAVKLLDPPRNGEDALSYRDARWKLDRQLLCQLSAAGFDTKDAELVPKAGACTTCPKRTGNQPQLFPDQEPADICTDRLCFQAKKDATWRRLSDEAQGRGLKVLEGDQAKKAVPYGDHVDERSGYASLEQETLTPGGTLKKMKTALGKDAPAPVAIVRSADGKPLELVDAKELKAALRKRGLDRKPTTTYEQKHGKELQERRKAIGARKKVLAAALAKAFPALARMAVGDDDIRSLAGLLAARLDPDTGAAIFRPFLRADPKPTGAYSPAGQVEFEQLLPKLGRAETLPFLILAANEEALEDFVDAGKPERLDAFLARCKVDRKKVEAELAGPTPATPGGKKPAPKKPAPAKAAGKKGARRG